MSDYTTEELMAVAVSRDLVDGDVCFIGLGTGGRGFTYAVGIPSIGIALAQRRGLDVTAQYGVMMETVIEDVPQGISDPELLGWQCRALLPVETCLDMFRCGRVDWGFMSAAQVDQYGNVNGVCIGSREHPRVRLVGPIAQPDHSAHARHTMIIVPHEARVLVERVDFIAGVGFGTGPGFRERYGLPGGGPARVITDCAVLGFDPETRRMRVDSLHPDASPADIAQRTGFRLPVDPRVPRTAPPSAAEVALIRNELDRRGVWLRGAMR